MGVCPLSGAVVKASPADIGGIDEQPYCYKDHNSFKGTKQATYNPTAWLSDCPTLKLVRSKDASLSLESM